METRTHRTRDTQLEAYESSKIGLSAKLAVVLQMVKRHGRRATFQLAEDLGWPINCISGKVTNLCDRGKLKDSQDRVVNPRSGKKCILWEASE